jgi:hypothetical protein
VTPEGAAPREPQRFATVVRDIYALLGLDAPAGPALDQATAIELEIDGISLLLEHQPDRPALAFGYCRFGALPAQGAEAALRRLMKANLGLTDAGMGAFGMEDGQDDIVYAFTLPLMDIAAADILGSLQRVAVQALDWRASHATPGGTAHAFATWC